MTAPINPSEHLSNPMSAHGGHHAPSPTGTPPGAPDRLVSRRSVQVLAIIAGVHLLADILTNYVVTGLAWLLPLTRTTLVILGGLLLVVGILLFISWLATVVAGIIVVIKERSLAFAGALVILLSALASLALGIDITSEGDSLPGAAETAAQAAGTVMTVFGILQTIALAVGLVMVIIALRRDRAASRG